MTVSLATEGPCFVAPYRPDKGGVDFLGLRQVNLDMMGLCLPGINNVTRYIRPFSVVSWIYWKFHQLSDQAMAGTVTNQELQIWKEKVEILFTWGHKLNGITVPGSRDAKAPTSGPAPLDFAAWKRRAQNTSLMAAVTYGPASKTIDGLGFLEPRGGGFFKTVGEGVTLAETLNLHLSRFNLLKDIEAARATAKQAARIFPAWSILNASQAERRAFKRAFFDRSMIGTSTPMGRRSTTIQLALDVLNHSGEPLSTNAVRALMFRGIPTSQNNGFHEPKLRPTWLRWIVLQTRQAQRLALEGLLRWFEVLLSQGYRDTEQIVAKTMKVIEDHDSIFPLSKPGRALNLLQQKIPTLDRALKRDRELSLFWLMDKILETVRVPSEQLAPYCFRTLFLCAALSQLLEHQGPAKVEIQRGGAERVSLAFWINTLLRCRDYEPHDFLLFLFETLILSQHFGVAARRFDGNTQRLRISIEEDGLEFLADKIFAPSVTLDRLESALSLMKDCGLIGCDDAGQRYFSK
jgi:hypothetical protein